MYGGTHFPDVEEIAGRGIGCNVQIGTCLCGIVAIAGVVEKTAADFTLSTGLQFQTVAHQVPMTLAGEDKAVKAVEVVGIF